MGVATLLTTKEQIQFVSDWTIWKDEHPERWPDGLEKSEAVLDKTIDLLVLKGDPMTFQTLDAALLDVARTPNIFRQFQQETIPNLKNANGEISSRNLTRLFVAAHKEFGKCTVQNMHNAVRLLASRGELEFETPLKSQAQRDEERTAKDVIDRVANKSANARENEDESFDAANRKARAEIETYYLGSDAKARVTLKQITHRHQQLGVPEVQTLREVVAFAFIENLLAHPSGETHSDFQSFRAEVEAVIHAEKTYEAGDRTDSAVWTRIQNTLSEPDGLLSRYSRSVR